MNTKAKYIVTVVTKDFEQTFSEENKELAIFRLGSWLATGAKLKSFVYSVRTDMTDELANDLCISELADLPL